LFIIISGFERKASTTASSRSQRTMALWGLHGDAGAGRDKLEGHLVVVDLGLAGTIMLARGAIVLALERDTLAFFLGSVGSRSRHGND
jgi:hypothetical protein